MVSRFLFVFLLLKGKFTYKSNIYKSLHQLGGANFKRFQKKEKQKEKLHKLTGPNLDKLEEYIMIFLPKFSCKHVHTCVHVERYFCWQMNSASKQQLQLNRINWHKTNVYLCSL